jgi:hypothetical protein
MAPLKNGVTAQSLPKIREGKISPDRLLLLAHLSGSDILSSLSAAAANNFQAD